MPFQNLDSIDFRGLTLFRVEDGFQANLSKDGTSWRVVHAATASAALRELLALPPAPLPPPPY